MSEKRTPAERLKALTELVASEGWQEVVDELKTRHAKALAGAIDLTTKGKARAGCAGAAAEIDQIIKHVPRLIEKLKKTVERENPKGVLTTADFK